MGRRDVLAEGGRGGRPHQRKKNVDGGARRRRKDEVVRGSPMEKGWGDVARRWSAVRHGIA